MSATDGTLMTASDEHALDAGHDVQRGGVDTALLGMLLFIASELMFFAALFGAYFNVRATTVPWPPEGTDFIEPWPVALTMTIILVASSFTMQWATGRIRKGDRTGMNRGIFVTLLLGAIFLCLVVFDYYHLVTQYNFGINSGVYGTLFYTMTGFHAAHVTGGVVGLVVILARGLQGQFSQRHHVAVEAVHYYWHFVDVVWIALFVTIYLMR